MECCKCNAVIEEDVYYICQTCDSRLCQICTDVHLTDEGNCDVSLLDSNGLNVEICHDHGNIVVSYCDECESLLCRSCIASIKTCAHTLLKAYSQLQCEFYHKVYEVINQAEDIIKSCENSISNMNDMSAEFNTKLESRFSNLHDCLNEMQSSILNDVKINCNFYQNLASNRKNLEHCNEILTLATSFLDTSFYENEQQLTDANKKLIDLDCQSLEGCSNCSLKFDFSRFKEVVLKNFELESPCEISAKRRKLLEDQDITSSNQSLGSLESIDGLVKKIDTQDEEKKLLAVQQIRRKLFCASTEEITQYIDEGLLNHILIFIQDEYSKDRTLQFESCWVLTNIASSSTLHTLSVVGIGCLPHLINLLNSPNEEVKSQALWTFANIIGDSYILRDQCIEVGVLSSLIDHLSNKREPEFLRTSAWLLSNVCRHVSYPIELTHLKQVLTALEILMEMKDSHLTTECFWAFTFICDSLEDFKQEFVNRGFLQLTIDKMQTQTEDSFSLPLINVVANLASSQSVCPLLVNTQSFGCLRTFLNHRRPNVREKTHAFISRATSLGSDAVQLLAEFELMPIIVEQFSFDNKSISLLASKVIKNSLKFADAVRISYFLSLDILESIFYMLTSSSPTPDISLLEAIENLLEKSADVESIRNAFEESGALAALEALETNEDQEVALKSKKLVCKFLDGASSGSENEG